MLSVRRVTGDYHSGVLLVEYTPPYSSSWLLFSSISVECEWWWGRVWIVFSALLSWPNQVQCYSICSKWFHGFHISGLRKSIFALNLAAWFLHGVRDFGTHEVSLMWDINSLRHLRCRGRWCHSEWQGWGRCLYGGICRGGCCVWCPGYK